MTELEAHNKGVRSFRTCYTCVALGAFFSVSGLALMGTGWDFALMPLSVLMTIPALMAMRAARRWFDIADRLDDHA